MQTFLPYKTFYDSLDCLDYRRLGKQRVEAMQILNCLEGKSNGWKNHPAVKMWSGYEEALKVYHNIAITLWKARGYKNTMKLKKVGKWIYPHWLNDDFCKSHRSNLLRKFPEHYGKFDWNVSDDLPYVWPV